MPMAQIYGYGNMAHLRPSLPMSRALARCGRDGLAATFAGRGIACKCVPQQAIYVIRNAEQMDAPGLAALDARCSRDGSAGWSEQTFRHDLDRDLTNAMVVQAGDAAIVGFGSMRVVAGEAELQNMAVAPEHRGQGLATQLLLALLQASGCFESESASGAPCHLEVRVNNTPAVAFYRALGFKDVGLRKRFYSDGTDALLMTRPPGPPSHRK